MRLDGKRHLVTEARAGSAGALLEDPVFPLGIQGGP
jgi:hypothetical protein